jgi:hypothetical protein
MYLTTSGVRPWHLIYFGFVSAMPGLGENDYIYARY